MRYWTVEEARAYLPRLRQLITMVRAAAVPGPEPGTMVVMPGAEHAEAALVELQEQGLILRQLDTGLVDFPSRQDDGGVRLLCWKIDEPDLAWWHWPADGFAGRRPLA